jgi:phage-related minor tail protein
MDEITADDWAWSDDIASDGGDADGEGGSRGGRRRLSLDTRDFKRKLTEADRLAKAFSSTLSKAFTDLAVKGKSFESVLGDVAKRLSQVALRAALKPLEDQLTKSLASLLNGMSAGGGGGGGGGLLGALGNGFGNWLGGLMGGGGAGSVLPFAKGGVVAAPTYFPMSGATGLMGERGAEAILPLARGSDGSLGVRASGGGGPVSVTVNISTPDVDGFRRSQAEVAAGLARAVERGRRGM